MNTKVKDALWLLLTGLGCSALAWAFWHYLGEHAFAVLMTIALLGLFVDNYRLRRRLQQKL